MQFLYSELSGLLCVREMFFFHSKYSQKHANRKQQTNMCWNDGRLNRITENAFIIIFVIYCSTSLEVVPCVL